MNSRKKKLVILLPMLVLFIAALPASGANLVAQWKLDEGSGQAVADSSGNGYDGQLGEFPLEDMQDPLWVSSYTDAFGTQRGPVLEFDGTYFNKRYVNLDAQVNSFANLPTGTISVFFKKDTLAESDPSPVHVNNNQVIFSLSDNSAPSCEFVMIVESSVLKIMSRGGTADWSLQSEPDMSGEDVGLTDGNWHHAAITVDALGNAALYVDGEQKATAEGVSFLDNVSSGVYSANTMALGANDDSGGGKQWAFDGLLSDVRVYDDALSEAEVQAIIPRAGTVTETDDSTEVTEGGATDTFDIVLDSMPSQPVTVIADPNDQLDLGNGAGAQKNIDFDSTNWDTPQTVTVTAVDDLIGELPMDVDILFSVSSSDPGFDEAWLSPRSVSVTVYDNDASNSQLVGHWKLDENTGQTAADSSGNGYDGVLGSTTGSDDQDPVWTDSFTDSYSYTRGPTLDFDGRYYDQQYVDLTNYVNDFEDLSAGTVSMFFKQDTEEEDPGVSHTTHLNLFGICNSNMGSSEFMLFTDSNRLAVLSRDDGDVVLSMESDVSLPVDGNWHHAAVSVSQTGSASLYLDGELVAISSGGFFSSIQGLNVMYIGLNEDSGGQQWGFDGLISDVRIYDNALTFSEVKELIPMVAAVTETDDSTSVMEGSTTDSLDVVLTNAPSSNVSVTIEGNEELDYGEGAGNPKTLTFTPSNWDTTQAVTLSAVDDLDQEGNETVEITYSTSSSDEAFDNGWAEPRTTTVTVLDNECGVWGYNEMDFNEDCYVDIADFVMFANDWLKCTDPQGSGCENLN
ncbi:LamG domain-containing protein [Sedimentisphaera salicampi]|uniref:Sialidase A n=1 Tax=Sedimentisphaera salicampi TaxID=1941349 RepID=A0A1W6LK58_9BACT|nr:LamG domain-containing protein [Sedimentisphaera salicampi]ARN56178.1 Sialidase A precursor [Sedimentisphaera salicampi]